jgi:hypothetical protein
MGKWGTRAAVSAFAAVGAAVWLSSSDPARGPEDAVQPETKITQPVGTAQAEPERPVTSLTQQQRESAMSPEVCSALNERVIGKVVDAVDHLNKYTGGNYKLQRNGDVITPVIPDNPPEKLMPHVTTKLRLGMADLAFDTANIKSFTGCDMGPAFTAISSYAQIVESYGQLAPETDPFIRDPKPPQREIAI